MKKHLTASGDSFVWSVTIALIGIGFLLLVLAGAISALPAVAVAVMYSTTGTIGLILCIGWLAKPSRYEIRDDSVTIVRSWLFPKIVIDKSDIKSVRHVRLKSVAPTSIAVMGIFGYAGRFRSEGMDEEFTLLATNPKDAVLLDAHQTYIISPANPKRFMNDLAGKAVKK